MPLSIASLNSGSNGNSYYIGNENEAVLIDAGISCREIEKRMARLSLQISKVKAVFISHEHSDHIRGVEVFSRKYKLPVYITEQTLRASGLKIEQELMYTFTSNRPVEIGNLKITGFPKFHDASEPHSFTVASDRTNIAVLTDIGQPCEHVIKSFSECHAAFLEANYDDKMLDEGNYPYYLKKRISGDKGHLSNAQALELFLKYKNEKLSHVLLSHLSKDNNDPQTVKELFSRHAGQVQVSVASRYNETPVYLIDPEGSRKAETQKQMTLF